MKHSVNIFFNETNYQQVKDLVERRKISHFINDLIAKNTEREERAAQEELRKRLIQGYQKVAKSEKRREEDTIWDETSSDGLKA